MNQRQLLRLKAGRRAWRRSVPSAVAGGSTMGIKFVKKYRMLIIDPSATADGTDLLQARSWSFEAKLDRREKR